MRFVIASTAILLAAPALAQQGEGVRISDHAINAGGHPSQGVVMASASYHLRFDSLAESTAGLLLEGDGYRLQGGFVACYPAPLEVTGLRFTDAATLVWAPERSAGIYNLYRGGIDDLALGGYGSCLDDSLSDESSVDVERPPVGNGFAYLVTAENRLEEEGSLGTDSAGSEREPGSPCP